ncbi:MAG: Myo-inositol 2-dehydrogenase, partial [uncultured Sphingomonadaceae bacterium]
ELTHRLRRRGRHRGPPPPESPVVPRRLGRCGRRPGGGSRGGLREPRGRASPLLRRLARDARRGRGRRALRLHAPLRPRRARTGGGGSGHPLLRRKTAGGRRRHRRGDRPGGGASRSGDGGGLSLALPRHGGGSARAACRAAGAACQRLLDRRHAAARLVVEAGPVGRAVRRADHPHLRPCPAARRRSGRVPRLCWTHPARGAPGQRRRGVLDRGAAFRVGSGRLHQLDLPAPLAAPDRAEPVRRRRGSGADGARADGRRRRGPTGAGGAGRPVRPRGPRLRGRGNGGREPDPRALCGGAGDAPADFRGAALGGGRPAGAAGGGPAM